MLSKICSQRCGLINFRIISFIWCGQLPHVLPTRPCLGKCYEVSGSFAIDFRSVRIAVNVGVGKNHKVGPSQSFNCAGLLCCCSSLASIPEEKLWRLCLCMCQLEQITVLGQDFFTVRTGFLVFNQGMQNADGVVRFSWASQRLTYSWTCRKCVYIFIARRMFLQWRSLVAHRKPKRCP